MKLNPHYSPVRAAAVAFLCAAAMPQFSAYADSLPLSYGVKTTDPVYPYTGFMTNEDVPAMNVAVLFPADMLSDYVGTKITALHIGWAGVFQSYQPSATAFLRTGLNQPNVAEASVDLTGNEGWNIAHFTDPYTIKDGEDIVMGYTVDMKSGVYGPCTLVWGSFPTGSHFISRPDMTDADGNPEWIDLATPGLMDMQCPVMIVAELEVAGGDFDNRLLLSSAAMPSMLISGDVATGVIRVENTGVNDVNSIVISCRQDGADDWSQALELSAPIAPGATSTFYIPVSASGKGEASLSVSKVNGAENGESEAYSFRPIVIPEEIAARYTRRPLAEYFASESDYRSGVYDQEIVSPVLDTYKESISRISWHCSDQFQIGLADNRDDVIDLMYGMVGNDSTQIYLPNMMVDRDRNLGIEARYSCNLANPMLSILYDTYSTYSYDYALMQPTFASIGINPVLTDEDALTVEVSGDIDLSVLPEGERLMLNVVLVEDGVESDSQEFPGGDGSPNPGHMVHNALVRQCLTPIWGSPLATADGNFREVFQAYLDEDNVPANMRVVAFLSRARENGIFERNVINSAETDLKLSTVSTIRSGGNLRPTVADGSLVIPEGASARIYRPDGSAVVSGDLKSGIYVVNVTAADGSSASFKIAVR